MVLPAEAGKAYVLHPIQASATAADQRPRTSAAFATGFIVSLATPEPESQEKFEEEKVRTYLGVGAE